MATTNGDAHDDKMLSITTLAKWTDFVALNRSRFVMVHFSTSWSAACKQTEEVARTLAAELPTLPVAVVEAEKVPQASLACDIVAVPTVVFLKDGEVIDRVDGVHVQQIMHKARLAADDKLERSSDDNKALDARIGRLIKQAKCMVFMKGDREQPQCGFSKKLVGKLNAENIDYETFDILQDEAVRQRLKEYSNWPTFPQVYLDGELVGGLDIVLESMEAGDLVLPKRVDWTSHLNALTRRAPVMVFMKGDRAAPRCKFSKAMMEMLAEHKVTEFDTLDILSDSDVRERLKEHSNWPTYPQVYVDGELIGGLDILKEMAENGELVESLTPSSK